jgi:hypothetical protein
VLIFSPGVVERQSPHLQSLNLDELLEPVYDEELATLVVLGDVSGVKPSVNDAALGGLLVVVVAFHDLRSRDAKFAVFVWPRGLPVSMSTTLARVLGTGWPQPPRTKKKIYKLIKNLNLVFIDF